MLDKSLARGVTRSALRVAEQSICKRVAGVCAQARVPAAARDEASAKQLADAWSRIYGERLVLLRAELAGRHSKVLCVAYETIENSENIEFWASLLLSTHGEIYGGLGDLKIARHALERYLQREAGLLDHSETYTSNSPQPCCSWQATRQE
jgi:hypothetical protein